MHLQCFPPTRYVMGGATRAHVRDDLYPICSKMEYGEPVCIVWLYNALYAVFLDNFFLLSVWSPCYTLRKKKEYRLPVVQNPHIVEQGAATQRKQASQIAICTMFGKGYPTRP
jgi:hypothetical protein